jgi:ubiquinone/menaquinone biosynthesis C-methylase UbiE
MSQVYSHGHHESVLRSHLWRTAANSAAYLLPWLKPGMDLLDIGCGPGNLTADLATRVSPGRTIGLDSAEDVLEIARQGAPEGVDFVAGDAYHLDYADDSFDVIHAHQVLQHLADPVAALVEMRRVVKPGGLVAARDADYGGMTWYPANRWLERWQELQRTVVRDNGGQADAGRYLLAWANRAGFAEVVPTASVWCFSIPADREWWGGLWADRIVGSSIAEQAVSRGLASREDLEEMAAAWRQWAADPDGWFTVLHGELICRP